MLNISFENTEVAFKYKSNKELKKAKFLFSSMGKPLLVKLGTILTPFYENAFTYKCINKKYYFQQFVGGETLAETANVVKKLDPYQVQIILDYGVEGKEGEDNFDHAADEFIRVIKYAAGQPHVPFVSVKLTGLARFSLLEKLHAFANYDEVIKGIISTESLSDTEKTEWQKVIVRIEKICNAASESDTGVLIGTEESWIQYPVDAVAMKMMQQFNKHRPFVYNTFQLYQHTRLQFLRDSYNIAQQNNFLLGAKLVRGAYMEKERKRASLLNYSSPIQADKQYTDADYNEAIKFCIENIEGIYIIIASHNEHSNLLATALMQQLNINTDSNHVLFSQLYGMSDNITFNLAKAGFNASKYLPFGPHKDVIPYLMRRAQENSSVSGQTGRELALIKNEMERRGIK